MIVDTKHCVCACCGSPIPIEEMLGAWFNDGKFLCLRPECVADRVLDWLRDEMLVA